MDASNNTASHEVPRPDVPPTTVEWSEIMAAEVDYAQYEDEEMEAQRKLEEHERKKAEVRKRLEEAGNKNKKKGFLTPERKKKLRKLLMMKAAEDLKQQQLLKAEERKRVLAERTIPLPELESVDDHSKLESIYDDMFKRMVNLETAKYDVNQAVLAQDKLINELTIAVNDLRGKFVKPALKKVSKLDNRFKKMTSSGVGEKQDFRANLKMVQKESALAKLSKKQQQSDKPDWSKKGEKSERAAVDEQKPIANGVEEEDVVVEEPVHDESEYEEEEEDEEEDEE
ncbi:hypothetical protein QR680_001703 [Steinernema hermaphroditum]|uniref:Troponin I n=1 Tax=Steinernema hermaphroditum TaxID=289476 RepID=A0AA39GZF9_9BILA|nr:hypothetical protein QR680_001703 [Steinernema hermaphroditum]